MTTETETQETKKPKQPADRYIFAQAPGSKDNKIVGSIYFHKKGNGMNVLINGKRYTAFAPKAKPADQPEQSQQPETEGKGA